MSVDFQTDCIPVCASCREAGECNKIWARNPVNVARYSSSANHEKQLAAIERELAHSWLLPCEHYTNHQEQEVYSYWKPKGKDWFCERCQRWYSKPRGKREKKEVSPGQETIPF